ncbi:hypothetical protein ACTR53_003226 [Escherichia coli]
MTLEQRINMLEITIASQRVEIAELRKRLPSKALTMSKSGNKSSCRSYKPFSMPSGKIFISSAIIEKLVCFYGVKNLE